MTTQSPHLYARRLRPAARPARATSAIRAGSAARAGSAMEAAGPVRAASAGSEDSSGSGTGTQTRLSWWAVAPAALAFTVLLTLLTAGAADASAAAPSGDWLSRAAMALPDLIHHLL